MDKLVHPVRIQVLLTDPCFFTVPNKMIDMYAANIQPILLKDLQLAL